MILGCDGFIGNNLEKYLSEHERFDRIYAISRRRGCTPESVWRNPSKIVHVHCDLDNEQYVSDLFGGVTAPDVIFHFGNPSDTRSDNYLKIVEPVYNVLKHAPEGSTVIYASSARVYGSYCHDCREHDHPKPENLYGAAKMSAESIVNATKRVRGINLRLTSVVGRHMNYGVVYDIINKLQSDKQYLYLFGAPNGSMRRFVHVDDVIGFMMHCVDKGLSGTYNVSSDTSLLISQVAAIIMEEMKIVKPIEWIGDEPSSHVMPANNKMLYSGYQLKYPLSEMAIRQGVRDFV